MQPPRHPLYPFRTQRSLSLALLPAGLACPGLVHTLSRKRDSTNQNRHKLVLSAPLSLFPLLYSLAIFGGFGWGITTVQGVYHLYTNIYGEICMRRYKYIIYIFIYMYVGYPDYVYFDMQSRLRVASGTLKLNKSHFHLKRTSKAPSIFTQKLRRIEIVVNQRQSQRSNTAL